MILVTKDKGKKCYLDVCSMSYFEAVPTKLGTKEFVKNKRRPQHVVEF